MHNSECSANGRNSFVSACSLCNALADVTCIGRYWQMLLLFLLRTGNDKFCSFFRFPRGDRTSTWHDRVNVNNSAVPLWFENIYCSDFVSTYVITNLMSFRASLKIIEHLRLAKPLTSDQFAMTFAFKPEITCASFWGHGIRWSAFGHLQFIF